MSQRNITRRWREISDLNGSNATEGPQIAIANPRMLLLDLLHESASDVETCVGTMEGFGFEAHCCEVAAHLESER
jgi:hypothetical protein